MSIRSLLKRLKCSVRSDPECGSCSYFFDEREEARGFCRRFPPVHVFSDVEPNGKLNFFFQFAVVGRHACCGEHLPK